MDELKKQLPLKKRAGTTNKNKSATYGNTEEKPLSFISDLKAIYLPHQGYEMQHTVSINKKKATLNILDH
jgi:hypothetical protein